MKHLIEFIDRWQLKRIAVVGDFMLDHTVYGNAERLSPDAPVPILQVEREEYRPGGASNVCMDLRALNCEVTCIGVVGADATADKLRKRLESAGCNPAGLIVAADRPTTVKRSYIGLAQHRHPQKMFRADFEKAAPVDQDTELSLIAAAQAVLKHIDVLCIEDYNKGVLTDSLCRNLITLAKKAGVPVLVDPAAIEDYSKYRGATAITPNRTEAQLATGLPVETDEQVRDVAARLLAELDLEAVVLTLDRQGALLAERSGEPTAVPTVARNVYDVSGAGDMVLAALAAARANDADWLTAVQLANIAAGLEVERFGVIPIELQEIHLSLLTASRHTIGKLRTPAELKIELDAYRRKGLKIAFTNGCFDIVHAGHVELLRGARATADLLVLAVNTDESIRKLKGPQRPIVTAEQRVKVLSELECVDYVVLFGDGSGGEADTPKPLLRELQPDVLVKGGTYNHDEVVGWEIVEGYGGKVVTIPPIEGLSTTNIVERIRAQD